MADSTSSISVIFLPVAPLPGTGTMTYHETLVYTTPTGSHYISAGPTTFNKDVPWDSGLLGKAELAFFISNAIVQAALNAPSPWGTLKVEQNGTFVPGDVTPQTGGIDVVPAFDPDTGIPNSDVGTPYPSQVLITGNDLSAQWATIVQTYSSIASLNLTYSPSTQNSNSVANTALAEAGVPLPNTSLLVPASDTRLPTTKIGRA